MIGHSRWPRRCRGRPICSTPKPCHTVASGRLSRHQRLSRCALTIEIDNDRRRTGMNNLITRRAPQPPNGPDAPMFRTVPMLAAVTFSACEKSTHGSTGCTGSPVPTLRPAAMDPNPAPSATGPSINPHPGRWAGCDQRLAALLGHRALDSVATRGQRIRCPIRGTRSCWIRGIRPSACAEPPPARRQARSCRHCGSEGVAPLLVSRP